MTYFIKMSGSGWSVYRSAGIRQRFRSLAAAKMLFEETGCKLVVLDADGLPMEV